MIETEVCLLFYINFLYDFPFIHSALWISFSPKVIPVKMNQSNSTIELSSSFQLEIRLGGDAFYLKSGREELYSNYLDKNYNIFQTTRFNHTMIFFKLIDYYKLRDIYISHNNCLRHMFIT